MRPNFDRSIAAPLVLPGLFSLLGLGLLVPALWFGYQSWAFIQAAQAAPGTVIALEWSNDSDGSTARPVVRYEVRGEPYEIVGSVSSRPPAYAVGEQVRVLYTPDQPRAARIESWLDLWFLPALLGGIGLVFGLVGIGLWHLWWKSLS
jgi:hypothetical protein